MHNKILAACLFSVTIIVAVVLLLIETNWYRLLPMNELITPGYISTQQAVVTGKQTSRTPKTTTVALQRTVTAPSAFGFSGCLVNTDPNLVPNFFNADRRTIQVKPIHDAYCRFTLIERQHFKRVISTPEVQLLHNQYATWILEHYPDESKSRTR